MAALLLRLPLHVSIHAPGRGATGLDINSTKRPTRFNSRTREGCDYSLYSCCLRYRVSIHAPGRGATTRVQMAVTPALSFNSRTREGCDTRCLAIDA